ncbi:hypothetical protein VULLAG_LOCUS1308 [Vulpes lagopus]
MCPARGLHSPLLTRPPLTPADAATTVGSPLSTEDADVGCSLGVSLYTEPG